ncbi:hypothetical protein [Morganella phage IME1369_01]|nr:hypothetical protein [Morganella phage IME1369_01]
MIHQRNSRKFPADKTMPFPPDITVSTMALRYTLFLCSYIFRTD